MSETKKSHFVVSGDEISDLAGATVTLADIASVDSEDGSFRVVAKSAKITYDISPGVDLSPAEHSPDLCVKCKSNPPEIDILYKGASSRAWLCPDCAATLVGKIDVTDAIRIDGSAPLACDLTKSLSLPPDRGEGSPDPKGLTILKASENGYILGVVLEPNDHQAGLSPDAQNDIYSEDDVRKAFEWWTINAGTIRLMHKGRKLPVSAVKVLDNYTTLTEVEYGAHKIRKGSWVLGAQILDTELKHAVRSGKLTGWSVGGTGKRTPVDG